MGCNCKTDSNGVEIKETNGAKKKKEPFVMRSILLVVKVLIFLIVSVIATVVVIPFSIYTLYKVIFLNEGLDMTESLVSLGKYLKKKGGNLEDDEDNFGDMDDEDEDDEEFEFEDEDEIVLLETK
jgi:hypothetical protein